MYTPGYGSREACTPLIHTGRHVHPLYTQGGIYTGFNLSGRHIHPGLTSQGGYTPVIHHREAIYPVIHHREAYREVLPTLGRHIGRYYPP